MKPILKIIHTPQYEPFELMHVDESFFFPSWHFHPQYEIMLVLEGKGIRFVGDSIERFEAGDLVFLGRDLPHFYKSDEEFYHENTPARSKAIVVYFNEYFLGDEFWKLPDIAALKRLFSDAKRGICFKEQVRAELTRKIIQLSEHKTGLEKLIDLLSVLQMMSQAKDYDLLSTPGFSPCPIPSESERMNEVYNYILDNYQQNPSLSSVSRRANMSIAAFCKYFKTRTNRTYTQFLNEIKIGKACKLLIENRMSIAQVSFKTGFNNLTHFNNQFKRITGSTPTQYQQQHLQGISIQPMFPRGQFE
jgi:AraC-like DNA-binding protein